MEKSELGKIDKGIYEAAQGEGLSLSEWMDKHHPPSPEHVTAGVDSFNVALGHVLAEQSGAALSAANAELFYQTDAGTILFPEWINRQVRIGEIGLTKKDVTLEDLVAAKTGIQGTAYRSVDVDLDEKKLTLKKVVQGAPMPIMTIKHKDKAVNLYKVGQEINVSYEVLRRMSLPLLSIHFQAIGKTMRKVKTAVAVDVLLNGDPGVANGAVNAGNAAFDTDGLIAFEDFMDHYEPTITVGNKATLTAIKVLAKNNALAASLGYLPSDLSQYKRLNWQNTDPLAKTLLAVDKSSALEYVYEKGSSLIETDKVINKQFEKTVISEYMGFSRLFTNSAAVWIWP